jgi:hypothetical protein
MSNSPLLVRTMASTSLRRPSSERNSAFDHTRTGSRSGSRSRSYCRASRRQGYWDSDLSVPAVGQHPLVFGPRVASPGVSSAVSRWRRVPFQQFVSVRSFVRHDDARLDADFF